MKLLMLVSTLTVLSSSSVFARELNESFLMRQEAQREQKQSSQPPAAAQSSELQQESSHCGMEMEIFRQEEHSSGIEC